MMVIHLLNHRRVHQKALTVKIAEFLKTVGSRRHRHTTIVVALRLWTVTRGDRSQQIISGFQLPPFQRHYKLVLVMFALSKFTTEEEIDYVIEKVKSSVERIRSISMTYAKQEAFSQFVEDH